MPRAKKILALASYATLALSAACQSQAPQYQLQPTVVAQSAPAPIQESQAPVPASQPMQAAPMQAAPMQATPAQVAQSNPTEPKPGAIFLPPAQPLTDAEGRPASGNVVRRKVSNNKPTRPLTGQDERPAASNVLTRTVSSDF
jgi:hypothetical protein